MPKFKPSPAMIAAMQAGIKNHKEQTENFKTIFLGQSKPAPPTQKKAAKETTEERRQRNEETNDAIARAAKIAGEASLPPKPIKEHPLQDRWIIQGFKLSPYKTSYFAVLKNSFFCVVRRCGENNLSLTRHICDLYAIPLNAKRVEEITNEKPLSSAFTPPFYFLDEHAAYQATIKTLIEFIP